MCKSLCLHKNGCFDERKRVVLSLDASDFSIGNSTVTYLKNESKIWSFVMTMESLSVCSKERKIMHLPKNEKVGEALCL